jgi:hypothetical protein
MHIAVRLVIQYDLAADQNHSSFIERLTTHLARKWSVAKADFDAKEYHYIWDFHDYQEPSLRQFESLPIGVKVRLTIK